MVQRRPSPVIPAHDVMYFFAVEHVCSADSSVPVGRRSDRNYFSGCSSSAGSGSVWARAVFVQDDTLHVH